MQRTITSLQLPRSVFGGGGKKGQDAGACRSFHGPKQGRHPAIEDKVLEWMHAQRKESLSVSYEDIEMKSRDDANDLNTQLSEFKISKKWITNFLERNRLSLQCCATVS